MDEFLKRLRPTLSAIAALAIAWSIVKTFYNNFRTPIPLIILVSATSISVLILPWLLEKCWPLYALIDTGVIIFIINISGYQMLILIICIEVTTILSDWVIQKDMCLHTFIFDTIISIVSAVIISFFATDIISIIVLTIMFSIALIVKTTFALKHNSLNSKNAKKTKKVENLENAEEPENIEEHEEE